MFGGPDDLYDVERDDKRITEHNLDAVIDYQNDKELLQTPKKEGSKLLDSEFFDKIEGLTTKLREINNSKTSKSYELPVKVEKKKPNYNTYRSYHKKPMNHPDNWKTI